MPVSTFTVLVDTREQQPFFYDKIGHRDFPDLKIKTATLNAGDYSIEDMSTPSPIGPSIALERKNFNDLFGSLGRGRERFERECQRLSEFTYSAIIIERDLGAIFTDPPETSSMNPRALYRSLIAFSTRYGICVWACLNRSMAEKTTFLLLHRFYTDNKDSDNAPSNRSDRTKTQCPADHTFPAVACSLSAASATVAHHVNGREPTAGEGG
jgi:ERCC4-type nuclease